MSAGLAGAPEALVLWLLCSGGCFLLSPVRGVCMQQCTSQLPCTRSTSE